MTQLEYQINKFKRLLSKLKKLKDTRGMGPIDIAINSSKVYDKGGHL